MSSQNQSTPFYDPTTELTDLGRDRFNHDTAQITDRDYSLTTRHHQQQPVTMRQPNAAKEHANQIFAWQIFQHTTEERDDREELKGDLHEGMLHRQNKVTREGPQAIFSGATGHSGAQGGRRGGRNDGRRGGERVEPDRGLCAGRKPNGKAPPLAKGFAEELDKSMFWDEPIV